MIKIKFAKTNENAIIPSKRDEDAGYDIFACFEDQYLVIEPGETTKIPTGIASIIPLDHCFVLKERGSTGSAGIGQRAGIIDSGFRNEWQVLVTNHNSRAIIIAKKGFRDTDQYKNILGSRDFLEYAYEKAICQALLIPVPESEVEEIGYDQLVLEKSERMLDGFGSTNKVE